MKSLQLILICLLIAPGSWASAFPKPAFYNRALAAVSTPVLSSPEIEQINQLKPFAAEMLSTPVDDPRFRRRPWFAPAPANLPEKPGLGLIIGGAALLAASILIINYGANYRNPRNNADMSGLFYVMVGAIMGAGGLGMMIPGIILKSRGR